MCELRIGQVRFSTFLLFLFDIKNAVYVERNIRNGFGRDAVMFSPLASTCIEQNQEHIWDVGLRGDFPVLFSSLAKNQTKLETRLIIVSLS